MSRVLIEACVGSVECAVRAVEAGADRIELNRRLDLNGLSPSTAEVVDAVAAVAVPVVVMVRPHDDGFDYSDESFESMIQEIGRFRRVGATRFAFGILNRDKTVDRHRMATAIDALGGGEAVFHRAFDVVADPSAAIEDLVDLGVTRVLTSGQGVTAWEGVRLLRDLVEQARDRIEILPGAGIGPSNAARLISETGCTQLHGSFRNAGGTLDPGLLRRTVAQLQDESQLNRL